MSKTLGQDLDEVVVDTTDTKAKQSKIVWNNHRAFSKSAFDFGKS